MYENPVYGIKIDYPASWLKSEINRNDLVAVFVLSSEKKPLSERNVSEFILENLMIGIKTIASSSLSSSSTSVPKNVLLNKFVNEQISYYKQAFTDFHIIASNTTGSIDNNPTYEVQYIHKNGRATFDTLQIWTIKGNSIYTIRFNADPADFPLYLPIIRKMTDSFVISKDNNNNQIKFKNV
ncbi:MAG: PsbP-related protein [Nitrososphaeraceae archaeon]